MRVQGALILVLAAGLGGCLSDLIPVHEQVSGDAGAPTGGEDMAGTVPEGQTGGGDDGGVMGPPDMTDCIPVSAKALDGNHNAGMDCLTCHNGTVDGASQFYVAGTLFSAATGTTGLAKATIRITDAAGKIIDLVTATDNAPGNFYIDTPVTFPIHVEASSCPSTMRMPDAVQTNGGSCNSCHNNTIQPQIHLP
jgi:hypothetical protein